MQQFRKILIVCASFYPINSPRSFRATELAKELARQGHQVKVLTTGDAGVQRTFARKYGFEIASLGPVQLKKPVARGNRISKLLGRAWIRGTKLFFEYPDIRLSWLVRKSLVKESGYDLLISVAVPYPIHWGVAWSRSKSKRIAGTWVADCGDPYMFDQTDTFRKPFYFQYIEKWFSRKADFVSIPNFAMRFNYYPEFHPKIVEIPQGFNFSEVNIIETPPKNECPTFAFAGNFQRKIRNPSPLLNFLVDYQGPFKFLVYTRNDALLSPFKEKLQGKLEIRPFIPRDQLLFELSKMDFLVNIGYDPQHQLPSKLIDYFLTRRPVCSFESSEFDPVFFEAFLEGDYTQALQVGDIDRFNIEVVAKRFLTLIGTSHLTRQSSPKRQ